MNDVKKIVIIGPESTGKSTLCTLLADHFGTQWVREYAREYLLAHGTQYTYDNLLDIARGQLHGEDEAVAALQQAAHRAGPLPLFIDTDMYVMKVWCEFVFDNCHSFILDQIAERRYDLYLLCDIDLPWVKDELREYPDLASRERLYHMYKDLLVNQSTPWVSVQGSADERLKGAIPAVERLLAQ